MGIDEAVEKAVQYREQGYHSIKMKIGTDVEEDIRRVCAVRDAVGYEMKLRVDANAGYKMCIRDRSEDRIDGNV